MEFCDIGAFRPIEDSLDAPASLDVVVFLSAHRRKRTRDQVSSDAGWVIFVGAMISFA